MKNIKYFFQKPLRMPRHRWEDNIIMDFKRGELVSAG
jgi:hypothetical protein